MSQNTPSTSFALRCGAAQIFYREGQPSRVGSVSRAALFDSGQFALDRAEQLGLMAHWKPVPVPAEGEDASE